MGEAFIKYKDEDDSTSEGWYELKEITSGYVTFLTSNNEITIPMNRIIKIKKRGEENWINNNPTSKH